MSATDEIKNYYLSLGIKESVYNFCEATEQALLPRFQEIDRIAEQNQIKVISAMQKAGFSESHLNGTTGYGYNDRGREAVEEIYAHVFHTEDALVRQQITCGTHALSIALSANLRPGDEILSPVGKVYDTLEGVIGIRESKGSLAEFGITFRKVDLLPDGSFDYDNIKKNINEKTKLIEIQRSKGYDVRPTLSVEQIGELIAFVKSIKPDVMCMVDNCYGEFVETIEPSDVGADMVVGSLIKKVGASLNATRPIAQGLFLAPTVTAAALKGAIFAANVYERLHFKSVPNATEPRYDIIQAVEFGKPEYIQAFCEGIQAAAPVDSFVTPIPWDMPGYDSQVIMAAGAFVSGASIELSADAPMKEPYAVYFQGGLTYPHAKFGIMMSLEKMVEKGLVVC